ncbi:hypothetical protein AMTR_s04335p00004830 [Amborella trichopoda]|uniref:Uncharacterized protein n=1 Tax=Amborella trichopoda TaxID=13333 RepID=U5CL04_AMBTC|nr:hypothetical protein AMTR_s04335p00004830 [Amborella trichopoda]
MTAFPALVNEADTLASHYRDIPLKELQSKEISGQAWTEVKSLSDELKNKEILIRGQAQTIRAVSKNMAFIIMPKTTKATANDSATMSRPLVSYSGAAADFLVTHGL